jgi:hypothetical protein
VFVATVLDYMLLYYTTSTAKVMYYIIRTLVERAIVFKVNLFLCFIDHSIYYIGYLLKLLLDVLVVLFLSIYVDNIVICFRGLFTPLTRNIIVFEFLNCVATGGYRYTI